MSRIALITPDFPPALGGIQRYLGEAADALAVDHDVMVITAAYDGGAAYDASRKYSVVRTRASWGRARTPAVLAEMATLARRSGADHTIAGHLAVLPSALAAMRRPVPCCFYGSEVWSPSMRPLLEHLAPRVQRAVCISRFTAREVQRCGVPSSRIRFVRPGADEPAQPHSLRTSLAARGLWDEATERPSPYLLSVGRLVEPHKGIDQLLRVLPAVRGAIPQMRVVIVGEGPLRSRYERIARAGGVADAVVWAGGVDEQEKGALLLGARALVMLSRESRAAAQFEGFGIVLLEAALAGRPAIAGASGGIPDAVVDGETGLLVDPADPVAILRAAQTLLEDRDLADRLGRNARLRAERDFTWEHVMRPMVDLVGELS